MARTQPKPDALIRADASAPEVAQAMLKEEVRLLERDVRRAAKSLRAGKDGRAAKSTHDLRIQTRRLGATLRVLGCVLGEAARRDLERRVSGIRKVGGDLRDADVHLALIAAAARRATKADRAAWAFVSLVVQKARKAAAKAFVRAARTLDDDELGACVRRLAKAACDQPERAAWTLGRAASHAVPELLGELLAASRSGLDDLRNVHALRVKGKALRYALEAFGGALDVRPAQRAAGALAALQRTLGELNDADGLLARVRSAGEGLARGDGPGERGALTVPLARLVTRQERVLKTLHAKALAAWRAAVDHGLEADVEAACRRLAPPAAPAHGAAPVVPAITIGLGERRGARGRARSANLNGHAHTLTANTRLAAIDVGTNSIRLIVAEAHPDGTYRILDDEKDIARLGHGLEATGRLDARVMDQAAGAIARMKSIAEGFGVGRLKAVATSAVREASNREEFCALVRARAGIDLEVIGGHDEALLAYRSVAGAFDLSPLSVAVVDIGGGSTEVVLAAGGVVEKVYTLPIGAVRLTERFGGADAAGGSRLPELKGALRRLFTEHIGQPPLQPHLVIATGGTSTTLGAVALQHGHAPDNLAPGAAVQGLEMKRSTVGRILKQLRALPVAERARVPGLPPERADIVVPGIAILHGLMKHLGVKRVRVHAGGIRDGLLLSMVRELHPADAPSADRDPMRAVYRLASACRFDQRHSEHVAALALRMFDQLAPRFERWARDETRRILHAGALLLDIGYLINYAKHHQHSYNLIRHSELPGFSARATELIALVARFHRGAEPDAKHDDLKPLAPDDRRLVQALAGIVRVAVGFDRAHRQVVKDVRVTPSPEGLRLSALADEEPAVDLWAAQRKSGLLARVLGAPLAFAWVKGTGGAGAMGTDVPAGALPLTARAGSSIG